MSIIKRHSSSLKDLIERIDWVMIVGGRHGVNLSSNEIAIGFGPSKRGDNVIDRVRMRIGDAVLQKLGWNFGDKICIYNDPNDYLTFMLVKSESGNGYKLAQESKSLHGLLSFKWTHGEFKLTRMLPVVVDYETHDKYLAFRVTIDTTKPTTPPSTRF